MLIESFNMAAQGAIEHACRLAVKRGHEYVTSAHMLSAMLASGDKEMRKQLELSKTDLAALEASLERRLREVPKAPRDAQSTPISRDLEAAFIRADEHKSSLGNKYIALNHVLLGMLDDRATSADLKDAACDLTGLSAALKTVRAGRFHAASDGKAQAECENLARFTVDLTERARAGKLDPVIGRDAEIRQVIQVLSRRLKNNPIIVGEPGVGKTAIVEGLAQRIAAGHVPENLTDHAVLSLDLGQLVAGTKFRGEFEERMKNVLSEVAEAGNVILFIDEIHMLVGTGNQEGGTDASNLLKPALARGELRCIGSTTLSEYRKRIEKDAALSRRFQLVRADEPSIDQALTILRGLRETYEVHHGVRITDAAINAAVRLSHRYISDRFLPDKAIDVMDQAAAGVRMQLASRPEEIERLEADIVRDEIEIRALEQDNEGKPTSASSALRDRLDGKKRESARLSAIWQKEKTIVFGIQEAKRDLEAARREMEQRVRDHDYTRVVELQYTIIPEREKRVAEFEQLDLSEIRFLRQEIQEPDIAETISRLTGIPVNKVLDVESERLMQMEKALAERVVNQNEAVEKISRTVRRARAGMQDPKRPLGSFLMLGPTGVGKTELAKALSVFLFDDERAMIRIDMSEYMEKHSVARLVGAPPGYVGFEEGGVLTNQVKRRPYCVILLDEVEKAHADVFNLLLQVLDDGRLTDSQGVEVSFKNTIIMLTSNLGAAGSDSVDHETARERMLAGAQKHFRPELLNRLDDLIVFRSLAREAMLPIARIQLNHVASLLLDRKCTLDVSDEAVAYLSEAGYDPAYGARPLKRVIQRELQDPLADLLIKGELKEGQTVKVAGDDAGLKLTVVANPA